MTDTRNTLKISGFSSLVFLLEYAGYIFDRKSPVG